MPRASKPRVGLQGGSMTGMPGPAVSVILARSADGSAWRWAKTPWMSGLLPTCTSPTTARWSPAASAGLSARGDLDVHRLERGERPGRLAVGEGGLRAGAEVAGSGSARSLASRRCRLLERVAELGRELHERLHDLHQHGHERPAAVGQRLLDHPPADRVHPAAPPPPGREERLERRRHVGDEPRSHRHLEVAHAVQVAERPGAVCHAGVPHRVAPGQLDEAASSAARLAAERVRRGGLDPPSAASSRASASSPRARTPRSGCASSAARRSRSTYGPAAIRSSGSIARASACTAHASKWTWRLRTSPPNGRAAAARRQRSDPRRAARRSRWCRSCRSSAASSWRRSPRARAPGSAWWATARPPSARRLRAPPGSATSPPPESAGRAPSGSAVRTRPPARKRQGPTRESPHSGRRSRATSTSRRRAGQGRPWRDGTGRSRGIPAVRAPRGTSTPPSCLPASVRDPSSAPSPLDLQAFREARSRTGRLVGGPPSPLPGRLCLVDQSSRWRDAALRGPVQASIDERRASAPCRPRVVRRGPQPC